MALVYIRLLDKGDGEVNVVLESEPPIPSEGETPAQTLALLMLDAVATPDAIVAIVGGSE